MAFEQIVVPPGEARLARVQAGERFRIVDLEGGQCVDFWAFCADDITEWASPEHTRVELASLFPKVGEHFVTNKRRELLLFEADDTPGVHDMLIAPCDPLRFQQLGVEGWHPSCQESFFQVVETLGWSYPFVPQSINWFTNLPVQPDGSFLWGSAQTKAGDSVTLKATMDCDLIVAACPQDITPINHMNPTSLGIDLLGST